ncbi:hypothetical protein ADT26_07940 [Xanthomonas oryzae]|nr:hypothetical protein AXO1947_14085 [Xanthomonas oryzae pv. oryzae]KOR45334.1 hypothetical protein ADT26_07940 [Xanthomonas oryzae]AUI90002.1 hypothetical protein BVV16_07005 [Xanthomonas oryzae pv. oryzae]AUI93679.1 hypothetical protein BVV17_07015 [Xanthomonas oryzae pv. oryzae]AUI97350.1 hypothetical protein BVV18_07025 [Xanthomonas oryzae pv. oryzae]
MHTLTAERVLHLEIESNDAGFQRWMDFQLQHWSGAFALCRHQAAATDLVVALHLLISTRLT